MICEDCVHHDLCFDNGTLFINFTTTGRKAENVETNCPFKNFKNKSEFVEVVRCKDCGSYNKHYGECTLNGSHFGENGYCCRGTRTPKERGGK